MRIRRSTVICATFAGFALAASPVEEPTKPVEKSSHFVLVTPGTTLTKRSGPIEPKSFEIAIGHLDAGDAVTFTMEFRNTSDTAIKILGGTEGCSKEGCIKLGGRYPQVIPAHRIGRVEATFTASTFAWEKREQEVEFQSEFYVGGDKTFSVPYRMTATVRSKK